jgi:hypothetical protein
MKFSQYCNLSESDKLLTVNEKQTKDEREPSTEPKKDTAYVVVPGHEAAEWGETLLIADVEKGTVVGRISARGRLISHPVVSGDQCSFAVQQQDGTAIGTTHQLPNGSLVTTFRIGGAGSKDVSFDPIFKRREDVVDTVLEPGGKVSQAIAKIADQIVQDVVKNIVPQEQTPVAPTSVETEPDRPPANVPGEPVSIAPSRSSSARALAQRASGQPVAPRPPAQPSGTYSPEIRRKFGLQ